MNTKSGRHTIFDITEFLPGRPIPKDFLDASTDGPFFFQPSWWSEENDWGGLNAAFFRKFPFCYSPGFATPEDALAAAEDWEIRQPELRKGEEAWLKFMRDECGTV